MRTVSLWSSAQPCTGVIVLRFLLAKVHSYAGVGETPAPFSAALLRMLTQQNHLWSDPCCSACPSKRDSLGGLTARRGEVQLAHHFPQRQSLRATSRGATVALSTVASTEAGKLCCKDGNILETTAPNCEVRLPDTTLTHWKVDWKNGCHSI